MWKEWAIAMAGLLCVWWIWLSSTIHNHYPGLVWKISLLEIPELAAIHERFVSSCVKPTLSKNYLARLRHHDQFQKLRDSLLHDDEPNVRECTAFELGRKNPKLYDEPMGDEYITRLGCLRRNISQDLELFAVDQLQSLMARWQLGNKLKRLPDSRGSTYMPPEGFMEYHSNQRHLAGWRLYFHYLQSGKSDFIYFHPYARQRRVVPDSNDAVNLFRIRKPPNDLLWHGIVSQADRFSWGIWVPPELAQRLKTYGERI